MTKGCYTCRRRRIVCDNEFPTCRKCRNAGKECLGYQKPLVWVKGGVASRGKMMGLSFDDVATQESAHPADSSPCFASVLPGIPPGVIGSLEDEHRDRALTNDEQEEHHISPSELPENPPACSYGTLVHVQNARPISPMYSLVDPLFQGLNKTERFYLDICKKTLMTKKKSPRLQQECPNRRDSQPRLRQMVSFI